MEYKPGICTFCGTGCGNLIKIKDGQIAGVVPSQNHPVSNGRLCIRGWHIHELLNSTGRIRTPLIRVNNKLEETSYEKAIAILIENLLKSGKESSHEIGFLASARSSNEENYLLMKLARSVFKTNNISLNHGHGHRNSLDVLHYGAGMAGMLGSLEEISMSEFIIVLDIDITRDNPIIGSEIHKAKKSGSTVITINNRLTQIAKLSGRFIQIRPGTEKVIVAALAKAIIENNLIDPDYINKHTEGFEEFKNSLNILNKDEILAKTGIEVCIIDEIATQLAHAKSAMVFFPSGVSGLDHDTISYIYNIFLMTGKIGKEGCGVNPVTSLNNLQGSYDMGISPDLLTGFQSLNDESVCQKFTDAWKCGLNVLPGMSINDMLENSNTKLNSFVVVDHDDGIIKNSRKIGELEFVAYIGAFTNDFMEYAHVVLPISTYIETDGTYTNTERRIQLSKKMVEPPNNILPGWELYAKVAEKAGAKWSYNSPSEVMAEIAMLTPGYSGITYEKLQESYGIQWPCDKQRPRGTKRFSIENSNEKLKFVFFKGTFQVPTSSKDFPYLLTIGKSRHYWHQNNLMKKTFIPIREYNAALMLYPEGYIEISPEDAKRFEIRDGWPVKVISAYGSMTTAVMISDNIKSTTAHIECFSEDTMKDFFIGHSVMLKRDEDTTIPVRIEKV